jgi:hypothetical protein
MLNAARILRLDAAPKSVLHATKHGVLNSGWLLRTNSRYVIFVKVLDLVDLFFRRVVVNRKSLSVRYAGIPESPPFDVCSVCEKISVNVTTWHKKSSITATPRTIIHLNRC